LLPARWPRRFFHSSAARQPTPTGTSKSNKRNQNLLV
jgi:hypothetical protein